MLAINKVVKYSLLFLSFLGQPWSVVQASAKYNIAFVNTTEDKLNVSVLYEVCMYSSGGGFHLSGHGQQNVISLKDSNSVKSSCVGHPKIVVWKISSADGEKEQHVKWSHSPIGGQPNEIFLGLPSPGKKGFSIRTTPSVTTAELTLRIQNE